MIRIVLLVASLALVTPLARADAYLISLTSKDSKPGEYGYTIRTVTSGQKITLYLELTPEAAKAFGHGELNLTKGGKSVVETTVTITKDGKGRGTLRLTFDQQAVDGGELLIWSGYIDGTPPVPNFGGFRLSIADLLAIAPQDPADVLMRAMDGFRKELPPPQGLNEMNGTGVADIAGNAHPDTHLKGIATRLEVKTRAECLVLMTYLKDPDPKIRRIAAFAIEGMVKAYPNGMSSSDIQNVESEGHRKMVKAFLAGIEKLPK